jgi:hypothetical protein
MSEMIATMIGNPNSGTAAAHPDHVPESHPTPAFEEDNPWQQRSI